MRQKATPSDPVSRAAAPSTPQNDGGSIHSRRRTDPLISREGGKRGSVRQSNRHSIDSTSRLSTSKSSNLPKAHSNSSPISSDNFSDPVLASFSPRKPKSLTCWAPALKLQTPPSTRDRRTPSPSNSATTNATATNNPTTTTTNNTVTTNNFSASPSAPPSVASSSLSQRPVSTLEPKSPPSQKRSPASRSSHGIETSSGPPPALSTQRSLSQDKARNAVASDSSPNTPRPAGHTMPVEHARIPRPSSSSEGIMKPESSNATGRDRKQRASFPARTFLPSRDKDKMSPSLPRFQGSLRTVSDRTERDESGTDTGSKETSGEETKRSEDLFLNIAKDTSDRRNSSSKPERLKTNSSRPSLSSRLQSSKDTSSPARSEYDADQSTHSQQNGATLVGYGAPSVRSPSTAHPLDETSRLRYFGINSRATAGQTRSRLGRANPENSSDISQNNPEGYSSTRDTSQQRSYRHGYSGGARSSRALSGADGTEHARLEADKSRYDGTESTLSTTAPSTVWDELDDLKSRIKKLEVTGRFPASSAAAMSSLSGERPRTATTTVTTQSSSPKHARKASTPPPESDTGNQIQNLLLTALAKAKPRLSAPVYQTLEATATDALALSTTLSSNSPHESNSTSHVNGNIGSDRQMRRKAESVCRSLTELCLALSEGQVASPSNQRPCSRDTSTVRQGGRMETESTTPTFSYRRGASHEPEDLHRGQGSYNVAASNGLQEGRRSSMLNLSSGNHGSDDVPDSPSTLKLPTPPTRLNRSSIYLRSRRLQGEVEHDDRTSTVSRPLSRAMTEAPVSGTKDRFSTRDRLSYTHSSPHAAGIENQSVHQEQSLNQYTNQSRTNPIGQSNIPYRRNYGAATTNIPAASQTTIQPGSRRYPTAMSGMRTSLDRTSSERVSEVMSSPHEGTQSRGTVPSRSATHHSSMQQLRPRTNSFGTRRISIRPRQSTVTANGGGMAYDGVD